jgi:hypothetical protein
MKHIRIASLVLGVASAIAWSDAVVAQVGADAKQEAKKKGKGKFTLSKETTYITSPLDKDGYPDYAAALNDRLRQGVTPDNNANVLLWKAIGPRAEIQEPAEFFRLLGMPVPPENGEYFVALLPYLKKHLKIQANDTQEQLTLNRCMQRPWTAKDHPNLAAWLKSNEKPLAMVIEASKRPHYYSPVLPPKSDDGTKGLASAPFPAQSREIGRALIARAMLSAAEGTEDAAWRDLLACHQLGRLMGRGGTLIDGLVAYAIDGWASKADLAFLDRVKPNAKQLDQYVRDLQKLPPLPEMADRIDHYWRLFGLETMLRIDRYGLKIFSIAGAEDDPAVERLLDGIDWDPGLRQLSQWYDRYIAAMREKDRASREKKFDQFEAELKPLRAKLEEPEQVLLFVKPAALAPLIKGDAKDRSKVLGDVCALLLTTALRRMQDAADRAGQVQDNLQVAFAMARYHRDHGSYPKELAALTPKYLAQVPGDRFSGKALVYRPTADGYLLFSAGVHGKDDEGRSPAGKPPEDNLTIRMPLPDLRR